MITRELAGDYVMYLYNNGFILGNRVAAKTFVQRKFKTFLAESNRTLGALENDATLDELLKKFGFVCKSIQDEKVYKFDYRALFQYRNEVMSQMDQKEIETANKSILSSENLNSIASIHDKPKVLEDFPSYELNFQFRVRQQINESFILSSKGCYCCQINFKKEEEYTAHIEYHSQETDFEYRNSNQVQNERLPQQFSISYQLCENSHLLFSIKPLQMCSIIIEKVVVFRSGTIQYLEDALVPYFLPSDGSNFYVNCHIFQIAYEQPLLVVYKSQNDPKGCRYIEEHHFLRFDIFPSNINLKTKHVFRRGELQFKDKIDEYKPGQLAKSMHFMFFDEKIHTIKKNVRDFIKNLSPLNDTNICDVFDLLIEMDDFALSKSYEKLFRKNIKIQGCGADYSTRILGLQEEQDGILSRGDRIILILKGGKKGKNGRTGNSNGQSGNGNNTTITHLPGMITSVLGERVYFESKSGKLNTDLVYDCAFEPQRLNIKYQHRALELLRNDIHLRARLFPEGSIRNIPASISLQYYNSTVAENPEQREAVLNIVDNNNKNIPFIIFGPPGTGKTTVVVETILQLWKRSNFNRILITAGSNAACDEVASRLCRVLNIIHPDGLNLLRIYSASYEKCLDNIHSDVLEASNLCYGSHFYPSLETIYTYPIVVATLAVAGRLVHGKISNSHFTHVFIDECGASTEPESLLSLSGILSSAGHLIISGDPKQLGPIIECQRAARYGLERSLLERLMDRECYRQHPVTKVYNRSIQARLVRNFRSHKDILAISNQLYYDNELKVEAPPEIINLGIGWSALRSKNFPILFESVKGFMRKLKNSTSSCNYEELAAVMLRVKELMFFGIKGRTLTENEIGIISPYKSQCQLLRRELNQRGWYKIETGSVETFQGQEKLVIIASLVRSRVNSPGFLDNPKRLNVLLTRAQALLILIGNPDTLKKIGDWKFVIEYCVENKAMIGAQMDLDAKNDSNESDSTIVSQSTQDLTIKDKRNRQRRDRSRKNDNRNQFKKVNDSTNMKAKNCGTGKKVTNKNIHRNHNKPQKDEDKGINWMKWLDDLPTVTDLPVSSSTTSTETNTKFNKDKLAGSSKAKSNTSQDMNLIDFSELRSELKGISDQMNQSQNAVHSKKPEITAKSERSQSMGTNKLKNQNENDKSNSNMSRQTRGQAIPPLFAHDHFGPVQNHPLNPRHPSTSSGAQSPRSQNNAPHAYASNQRKTEYSDPVVRPCNHNSPSCSVPEQSKPYPFEVRGIEVYSPQGSASRITPIYSNSDSFGQHHGRTSGTYGGYPYPQPLEPTAPALTRQEIIQRQPPYNPSYASPQRVFSDEKANKKRKDDACILS